MTTALGAGRAPAAIVTGVCVTAVEGGVAVPVRVAEHDRTTG
jgi:hypothetical protein